MAICSVTNWVMVALNKWYICPVPKVQALDLPYLCLQGQFNFPQLPILPPPISILLTTLHCTGPVSLLIFPCCPALSSLLALLPLPLPSWTCWLCYTCHPELVGAGALGSLAVLNWFSLSSSCHSYFLYLHEATSGLDAFIPSPIVHGFI